MPSVPCSMPVTLQATALPTRVSMAMSLAGSPSRLHTASARGMIPRTPARAGRSTCKLKSESQRTAVPSMIAPVSIARSRPARVAVKSRLRAVVRIAPSGRYVSSMLCPSFLLGRLAPTAPFYAESPAKRTARVPKLPMSSSVGFSIPLVHLHKNAGKDCLLHVPKMKRCKSTNEQKWRKREKTRD